MDLFTPYVTPSLSASINLILKMDVMSVENFEDFEIKII